MVKYRIVSSTYLDELNNNERFRHHCESGIVRPKACTADEKDIDLSSRNDFELDYTLGDPALTSEQENRIYRIQKKREQDAAYNRESSRW